METEKMTEKKEALCERVPSRPVPSFREVLADVRRQICLTDEYDGLYPYPMLAEDIAKIMTEVYLMRDESNVIISGETIPGYLVKGVYKEVDAECVRAACDRFCEIAHKVVAKKAYLRAALYNAVFETAAGEINDVNVDMAGGDAK